MFPRCLGFTFFDQLDSLSSFSRLNFCLRLLLDLLILTIFRLCNLIVSFFNLLLGDWLEFGLFNSLPFLRLIIAKLFLDDFELLAQLDLERAKFLRLDDGKVLELHLLFLFLEHAVL